MINPCADTLLPPQEMIDALSAKLLQSANKVINYLGSQLQKDGSFGPEAKDIACYFKSPMLFLLANKPQIAINILKYIKKTFITSDGDFTKSANVAYSEYWTYTNGWIMRAANLLDTKDIIQPAFAYIQQYYLGTGLGFSTNQINKDPKMTDVLTNSHLGLLNLETDNIEIAIAVGNYLCHALTLQPDLKKGFYLRLDTARNLIMDFPVEQTAFCFINTTQPQQLYFMIGYPAAYLAILYKKTKNTEFLTAAIAYLEFALSCDKSIYTSNFSHKIAWAASHIYECTNNPKYLDVINKISHHFISNQQENGMWFTDDIDTSYDQSAEIACWFLDIVKNINKKF